MFIFQWIFHVFRYKKVIVYIKHVSHAYLADDAARIICSHVYRIRYWNAHCNHLHGYFRKRHVHSVIRHMGDALSICIRILLRDDHTKEIT